MTFADSSALPCAKPKAEEARKAAMASVSRDLSAMMSGKIVLIEPSIADRENERDRKRKNERDAEELAMQPEEQPAVEPVDDQLGTEAERTALRECEAKIQAGLSTFVEVGNALMEIRDDMLYRMTHARFEDYCREKWGMARQHANRLIAASEVVGNLEPIGSNPQSESQVRPLAHLPPEKQKEVWAKAVEIGGGKPTAKVVKRAVAEVVAHEKPERPKAQPEDPKLIIDEGWGLWLRAKILLDQISKRDASRQEALEAGLAYITGRLEGKR